MTPAAETSLRAWVRWLVIAGVFGSGLAAILRVEPLLSANDVSRWATVRALVERGTWRIDEVIEEPGWNSIDKVRHEEHFYSSKPPLLPALTAGVCRLVQLASELVLGTGQGWTLATHPDETIRTILVLINLLPFCLSLNLWLKFLSDHTERLISFVFLAAAASWGTYLFTFLVTFNNHLTAAISVMITLTAAGWILSGDSLRRRDFLLAGFFAMFTCTNELPAALFGLALFGLLAWKQFRWTALYFIPAALLPFAGHMLTTYLSTGGWKPFYSYYGTEKYNYVLDGIPSYWMNPQGLDRATDSPWVYFLHCVVGHHGIFSLSPVFLLTLLSWGSVALWRGRKLQSLHWLGLLLTVAVLGFYLTRTENYNYGGNTAGLRWMFWLIPFWLLSLPPVLDRFLPQRGFQVTALLCLSVSIFSACWSLPNPWKSPWLFSLMERWEWIDYSAPPPPELPRRLTTWIARLPEPGELPAWMEFASTAPDGQTQTLRLEVQQIEDYADRPVALLHVSRWTGGQPTSDQVYPVDISAFTAGNYPERLLRGVPDEFAPFAAFLQQLPLPATLPLASAGSGETFLRGVPVLEAEYSPGAVGYVRTALRNDAFRAQKVQAQAYQPAGELSPARWYRTEVWLCDQLPFGVLRLRQTVYDGESFDVISQQQWEVSAASAIREPNE